MSSITTRTLRNNRLPLNTVRLQVARPQQLIRQTPRLQLELPPQPLHRPLLPLRHHQQIPLLSRPFSTTTTNPAKMGAGEVHNLKSKAEYDAAVAKGGVMVLDCFATWCGPCKVIAPKVVEFSGQYTDANFYKVDVDEVPDVAQELGITAMPTFILFKDGKKAKTVVGANPKALESAITSTLSV